MVQISHGTELHYQDEETSSTHNRRETLRDSETICKTMLHPYGRSKMDNISNKTLANAIVAGSSKPDGATHFSNLYSKDDKRVRMGISQLCQTLLGFCEEWDVRKGFLQTLGLSRRNFAASP